MISRTPDLAIELRRKLTETERELLNPILFTITRRQLEARAERLRFEIHELEHPTPFLNVATRSTMPSTELRFADGTDDEEEQQDATHEQHNEEQTEET